MSFAILVALAIVQVLHAQTTNCVPAPSGLVSWWPAEGDASDLNGGHNGTLNGGVSFIQGMSGMSFQLDGSGYIQIPASTDLDVGNGPGFTIEGWIAPDSVADQMPIVEWSDPTQALGAHFWISVPAPWATGPGCRTTSG